MSKVITQLEDFHEDQRIRISIFSQFRFDFSVSLTEIGKGYAINKISMIKYE